MAHQLHLEKEKYRQWVKAGLGLEYLKEGLAPFCDNVTKQQHKDILDNIKQTKNLSTVACGQCALRTLKPDHVKSRNGQCPLRQANCNCCYTSGKMACPNNACGAIYDSIITNHASTPPAPFWKNTQTQQWTGNPWSIAKCFINAPGYEQKISAADIDCTGLLHVIINNKYFRKHVGCNITGTDVFSKVRQYRNKIFHSSSMELEKRDASFYIDDMIAILEDGKELSSRQDSKDAVKKLKELKKDDFIITTKTQADVVHAAVQSINYTIEEYEDKLREKFKNVPTKEDVENKLRENLENVPSTEDVEGLETRVAMLELDMAAVKEEMIELRTARSSQQDQYNYIKSKLEFQETLMGLYRKSLLLVSAKPLKPEHTHCNFSEVYVRPRMTHETRDVNRRPKETEIQSLSDILIKAENSLKSIYVLGDAGSGKSSFCKSLVNCWCMAHSGEQTVADEFDGIKEMKKFEFLFYISLRRFKDVASIQEMIEKQYRSKILNEILSKESRNIIIVLDGLDEWSCKTVTSNQFQTESLPERDTSKDYTVITTSRPWKIETLGLTDKEIEQRIKLKGFDTSAVETMIKKTVSVLNKSLAENKSPSACEDKLNNKAIASIKKVPIMLLQLICLWFDDTLQVSSRCAIYSGMLTLFLSWNDKKKNDEEEERLLRTMSKDLSDIELPQYLMNNKLYKLYKYLIHELSRLAYKTLFRNEEEASLTFENFVFEELEISDKVKTSCLKLGILSEEECPSLRARASTSESSLLSFVDKSVQEFLAAVYIAIKLKAHIAVSTANLSDHCAQLMRTLFCQCSTNTDLYRVNTDWSDHCAQRIKELFSNCTTLDAVLKQTNVFIMLCGLEPRIATFVSKYTYDIVTRDKRVLEYRQTIDDGYRHENLISNIQEYILNSIEEVQVYQTNLLYNFYVGDIVVQGKSDCNYFCTGIDKQYIFTDSVRSFSVNTSEAGENLKTIFRCLTNCRRLEKIHIDAIGSYIIGIEDIKSICGGIEANILSLKSLYVGFKNNDDLKPMYKTIVRRLPDMSHLVALHIAGFKMQHEDLTSLCIFLSGSSRFEQISISCTVCERTTDSLSRTCMNQHNVDLSKHQQLQYLKCDSSVTVTSFNTSNLEIFTYKSRNRTNFMKVFDNLSTANKLTKLDLMYDIIGSDNIPLYHNVTDKLIPLLPLLHQLRKLTLRQLTFTNNIMKSPSKMKNMEFIDFYKVRMSFATWRQFVDSLPQIPLPVTVRAENMCIRRDGEEFNQDLRWMIGRRGEEAAAWQYVTEHRALFNVDFKEFEDESRNKIRFSTKK